MSILRGVLLVLACALILTVSPASSNNGMELIEFPFEETMFIDCLDEEVALFEMFSARIHEFETPSGSYHFALNADFSGYVIGITTGYTWDLHKITGAQQINIRKGEASQFALQGVLKPTSPGAPTLIFHHDFKVTVTANGNLIVFRQPSVGSKVQCIW